MTELIHTIILIYFIYANEYFIDANAVLSKFIHLVELKENHDLIKPSPCRKRNIRMMTYLLKLPSSLCYQTCKDISICSKITVFSLFVLQVGISKWRFVGGFFKIIQ